MTDSAEDEYVPVSVPELHEIQFFTFRIQGILFGIEAGHIAEVMDTDHAKEKFDSLLHFHEKVSFGGRTVTYEAPKVIVIKDGENKSGIIIDRPEDIITVQIEDIQPMPLLIKRRNPSMAVWGGVLYNMEMMLLVDSYRLKSGNLPLKAQTPIQLNSGQN